MKRRQREAKIMKALDRMLSSHARDEDSMGNCLTTLERQIEIGGWPDDAIRAVIQTLVAHAPPEDLDTIEQWASSEVEWTEGFEIATRYRNLTGHEIGTKMVDVHTLARAARGDGKTPITPIAPEADATEVH